MKERFVSWATSIPGSIVIAGLLIAFAMIWTRAPRQRPPASQDEYLYHVDRGMRTRVHKVTGVQQVATEVGWQP